MGLPKAPLQLVELPRCEPGPVPLLLAVLVLQPKHPLVSPRIVITAELLLAKVSLHSILLLVLFIEFVLVFLLKLVRLSKTRQLVRGVVFPALTNRFPTCKTSAIRGILRTFSKLLKLVMVVVVALVMVVVMVMVMVEGWGVTICNGDVPKRLLPGLNLLIDRYLDSHL